MILQGSVASRSLTYSYSHSHCLSLSRSLSLYWLVHPMMQLHRCTCFAGRKNAYTLVYQNIVRRPSWPGWKIFRGGAFVCPSRKGRVVRWDNRYARKRERTREMNESKSSFPVCVCVYSTHNDGISECNRSRRVHAWCCNLQMQFSPFSPSLVLCMCLVLC